MAYPACLVCPVITGNGCFKNTIGTTNSGQNLSNLLF
jgi:hypothetical protein